MLASLLFAGAAQPRGPFNGTMDSNDAIEAAAVFSGATIVSVHNLGWSHYTQSQQDLVKAFEVVGIGDRIRKLTPARLSRLTLKSDPGRSGVKDTTASQPPGDLPDASRERLLAAPGSPFVSKGIRYRGDTALPSDLPPNL